MEDSDASLEEGEEASTRFNSGTPVDGQWRQLLHAYFVYFRDNSKEQKTKNNAFGRKPKLFFLQKLLVLWCAQKMSNEIRLHFVMKNQ